MFVPGGPEPPCLIIGLLVSLLRQRLGATFVAVWVIVIATLNAVADAPTDSTWVALKPLPHQGSSALFALAVDPSNNQVVVAGNSEGSLLRSPNAGTSWVTVHTGKADVIAISFSPFTTGLVVAGTRGSGVLASRDGGATWSSTSGLEGRTVRAFAFALTLVAAGTDRGVYLSSDGFTWTQSGLANRTINALAVEAIHAPVRLVAGSDSQASGGILPLYQSLDAGATWTQFNPPISGTIAVKLVAGPLPPTGNIRPLLVGTNTGLFASTDNGASFNPLSGGGLLPTTDYTQVNFITDHHDRFYAASDGGGSKSGGLWRTDDGGQSFTSLDPPERSVTALAVSNDEHPTLYVATFRPSTHTASLWTYHDTFGTPQGPPVTASPVSSGSRTSHSDSSFSLSAFFASPQLPYISLGIGALIVICTAVVAHLRGRVR
jgi:photosystem II stability/assembly factor-like uncharacterized protein